MAQYRRQGRIRKDSASSRNKSNVSKGKVRQEKPDKRKRKRSLAAKKGHKTRKLKFKGVDLNKRWEGRDKNKNPTGYIYERYNLPILDAGSVANVIEHVKKSNKGKRFLVGGQADFRDKDDRLFTNNASLHLDIDKNAPQEIVSSLHKLIISPSNPFQVGRSTKIDIENSFVIIRFKRERFHEPKKKTGKGRKRKGNTILQKRVAKRKGSKRIVNVVGGVRKSGKVKKSTKKSVKRKRK